jgi:hypothetical protein
MVALYGSGYQKENEGELVLISNTMPFLRNVSLYDLFAPNRTYE